MAIFSWLDKLRGQRHYELGKKLSNQGLHTEAIKEYRETIKIDPDNVNAYVNLAAILEFCGLHEEAEKVKKQLYVVVSFHAARGEEVQYDNLNNNQITSADKSLHEESTATRKVWNRNADHYAIKQCFIADGVKVVFKKSCPDCGIVQFVKNRPDPECDKCGKIGRVIVVNVDEIE